MLEIGSKAPEFALPDQNGALQRLSDYKGQKTAMAENDKLDAVSLGDDRYKCPCGYIYDPAKGDPKNNIPAGTRFEDLPDDWRCPRCKRKKEKFKAL